MPVSPKISIDSSDVAGAIKDEYTVRNAITAYAGGGQTNAVALTARFNRITTVATTADSVKLPAAEAGASILVFNKGANSANVFPASGDAINAGAADAAYALAATKGAMFVCMVNGTWDTILTA
jgi:ABC-type arginine transport system permease subunit